MSEELSQTTAKVDQEITQEFETVLWEGRDEY